MSDLPPRSRHRMTVLECPLWAISRHSLAIRPLYSLAIRPSTAATHGRLPWGARLAWKLNSKKLLKKIGLEMCLRIILFSFAIVTIIVSAPPAHAEQIGSAEQGLTIAREMRFLSSSCKKRMAARQMRRRRRSPELRTHRE